jgi:hypothetical protein
MQSDFIFFNLQLAAWNGQELPTYRNLLLALRVRGVPGE